METEPGGVAVGENEGCGVRDAGEGEAEFSANVYQGVGVRRGTHPALGVGVSKGGVGVCYLDIVLVSSKEIGGEKGSSDMAFVIWAVDSAIVAGRELHSSLQIVSIQGSLRDTIDVLLVPVCELNGLICLIAVILSSV